MSTIEFLSDEELLEGFISGGAVKEMVATYGSVQQALLNSTNKELERLPKIGTIRAKQLLCITELAKRLNKTLMPGANIIRTPKDVFNQCREMQSLEVEEVRVLCLNSKNAIIARQLISKGSLTASIITPREVYCSAIRIRAGSIILVHNHPSGISDPSDEDRKITEILKKSGEIIDLPLVDHIIIGKGRYFSFKEDGTI